MGDNSKVKADMSGLEALLKALKDDKVVRIGIIGSRAHTEHKGGLTNAELGTIHEFGGSDGKHPPRRSFLEEPLKQKLNFNNEDMKAMRKSAWKNIFVKKDPEAFLMQLGAKAMSIIEGAFLTYGYGQWKPLAASTWAAWEKKQGITGWRTARSIATFRKGLNKSLDRQPLVDTGKLKGSISFKVIKKK